MKEIRISMFELIGGTSAVSQDDAQLLFERISKGLENKIKVIIDFNNIELITPSFMQVAFGQLYGIYTRSVLGDHIRIENITKEDFNTFKRVAMGAKEYFRGDRKNGTRRDQTTI